MSHIIKKLRNKSEGTRLRIAIVISLVVTIFLLFLWVLSLDGHFQKAQAETPSETQPFAILKAFFSSGVSDVNSSLQKRKDSMEDFSEAQSSNTIAEIPEEVESVDEIEELIDNLYLEEGSVAPEPTAVESVTY